MKRRKPSRLRRERLPWAFGLLAISVFHVANGNAGAGLRPWHLGVLLTKAMGS